jgi:soluble lytic murein transglycosylase-like protein
MRAAALALRVWLCAAAAALLLGNAPARADRLVLVDGTSLEVDEAWEDAQGVWYRRGNVTSRLDRARLRRIERDADARDGGVSPVETASPSAVNTAGQGAAPKAAAPSISIYLVGGARMEVDEVTEQTDGVWYKRDRLSIFIDKARIERIEREVAEKAVDSNTGQRARGWTTGSARIDELIRQNGVRHGVDPYLIFCVMEHESNFRTRAISPVGARGLMQLMPGTAARFGVRNVFDPVQNISGGTRYLKELLKMWDGRVDLALASYNAGEGAVLRYGMKVPPYRETRNYVRLVGARYGKAAAPTDPPSPHAAP